MYYAKSTTGFYSEEIHGKNIPNDSVSITKEHHALLLTGQSQGKVIVADNKGYPTLADAPVLPPQVPLTVTMRQARLALHAAKLLTKVEVAIDSLPESAQVVARIEWGYASEVHRNSEFVVMMGQALEINDEDLDNLFFTASSL